MISKTFLQIVRKLISTPAHLMIATWVIFLFSWYVSPLIYNRQLSFYPSFFLIFCVSAFAFGAWLAQGRILPAAPPDRVPGTNPHLVNSRIRLFAIVGLLGTICIAIDKLLITGLDFSEGLGVLRSNLAEVHTGTRSLLLWVGMAAFSFTDVAVMLYVLEGESCDRVTGSWVFLVSFCPMCFAVLYAGRSSSLVLLILAFCASFVRVVCGRTFWPKAPFMQTMIATHGTIVVALTLYIFSVRSTLGYDTSYEMLVSFTQTIDATIAPELRGPMSDGTMTADVLACSMLTWIYATHGLTEFDYLLTENADAGPFYGWCQGWILYRGIAAIFGLPDRTEEMENAIHHVGFFPTAWGACYLDFGSFSPGIVFLMGLFSGVCYRLARSGGLGAQMLLAFMYGFILFSPMFNILQAGNGLQVLLCILAAIAVLPSRRAKSGSLVPLSVGYI